MILHRRSPLLPADRLAVRDPQPAGLGAMVKERAGPRTIRRCRPAIDPLTDKNRDVTAHELTGIRPIVFQVSRLWIVRRLLAGSDPGALEVLREPAGVHRQRRRRALAGA